ncbi:MAG: hypothetical protein QG654_206 [Patescibacteria group bacterium]|nr:hypothetical protein [Patescibacteria group bacterium]
MDDNQKKLIADQMKKIPTEVREAILSSDWERTIFNIGREHKMHIDDIDTLSVETILTMIGLEHPKDYPENIQKRIGLSDDDLMNIVDQVNERLFSKIREALRIHYEKISAGEIMADEEKDELHHAGVDLEDDYSPRTEKKPLSTMIDKKILTPEPVIVKTPQPVIQKAPVNVPAQQVEEKIIKIPEIRFDPYREPIE